MTESRSPSRDNRRLTTKVSIGDVDVSAFIGRAQVHTVAGGRGSAEIELRAEVVATSVVDFTGEVTVSVSLAADDHFGTGTATPTSRLLFTGTVQDAHRTEEGVMLRCSGGSDELTDSLMSHLQTNALTPEKIWSICRLAGIEADKTSIEGLDLVPEDEFVVLYPIGEMSIEERVQVGRVQFLPGSDVLAARFYGGFTESSALARFHSAEALAWCTVRQRLLFDAERDGTSAIDEALGWLTLRAHDSRAVVLGRLEDFDRQSLRAVPYRDDAVIVHGLLSQRRWLRTPTNDGKPATLALTATDSKLNPQLPTSLTESDHQAISAWMRARRSTDPLAATLSLWEAIEFYIGSRSAPDLFTSPELKQLSTGLKRLRRGLATEQVKRLGDAFGLLNSPPLMARLRWVVDSDQVPITEADFSLLRRLRDIRNDALHGKQRTPASAQDVRRGLALVARMLVHRIGSYPVADVPG
jgi:hypothetical protein